MEYTRGWVNGVELIDLLKKNYEQDKRFGITNHGPHRADLKIKSNGLPAQDIFSRGQQKLFICMLKLAQGILFSTKHNTPCIYLVDDITSELDQNFLTQFLDQPMSLKAQTFMTSIYEKDVQIFMPGIESPHFEIKHGAVPQIA
jgi:DNA replication and repair protein RecF